MMILYRRPSCCFAEARGAQYPLLLAMTALVLVVSGCEDTGPSPIKPLGLAIQFPDSLLVLNPGAPEQVVTASITRAGYDGGYSVVREFPATLQEIGSDAVVVGSEIDVYPVQLRFRLLSTTPAGEHPVTIIADGGEAGEASATLIVRLEPFNLFAADSTVKVSRGSFNVAIVHVQRAASSTTAIEVLGAPVGVSISTLPQSSRYRLEIAVGAEVALGDYALQVRVSSDTVSRTLPLTLVVREPLPTAPLAFNFCLGILTSVTGFAYSNDGEPWRAVVPDASGVIRFDATERLRFRHTYGFNAGNGRPGQITVIVHARAAELAELQCSSVAGGTKSFTFAVENATGYAAALGPYKAPLTSAYAPEGPLDLVAVASAQPSGEYRSIIRRELNLPGGSTVSLDFGGGEAIALDSAAVSGSGWDADSLLGRVAVITPTTVLPLPFDTFRRTSTGGRFLAVRSSELESDELHALWIRPWNASRGVVHYFREPADQSVAIGPPVSAATIVGANVEVPSQPEYPDIAGAAFYVELPFTGAPTGFHSVHVYVTREFLGGTPAVWSVPTPDFEAEGPIRPGAGASAFSGRLAVVFGGAAVDGEIIRYASLLGNYLPFPAAR